MASVGFTPVPRKLQDLFSGKERNAAPTAQTVQELGEPQSELAKVVDAYARQHLPTPTYNHSRRVYFYGRAILKDQFPDWSLDPDVYFVTCMMHDIGTTDANQAATKMSFEFWGAILTRDLILNQGESQDYADAVCEAIILHQDLTDVGFITTLGQLIQITTLLDNAGHNTQLIDRRTIDSINAAYPRLQWHTCFADKIGDENRIKPWCHTSTLGVQDFPNLVLNNTQMPYQ